MKYFFKSIAQFSILNIETVMSYLRNFDTGMSQLNAIDLSSLELFISLTDVFVHLKVFHYLRHHCVIQSRIEYIVPVIFCSRNKSQLRVSI